MQNIKIFSYKHSASIGVLLLAMLILLPGCKKLVEADPPPDLSRETVFTDDKTATAFVNGIYSSLSDGSLNSAGSLNTICKFLGLTADELTLQYFSNLRDESYY